MSKALSNAINKIKSNKLDQETILALKNEIFTALLNADIDYNLAGSMVNIIQQRALSEKLPQGVNRRNAMITIVYEELANIMGGSHIPLNLDKGRQNILMTIGIQGSGKTTTIGKLALLLKKEKWNIGLICTDTWRPGAYDQLKQLGNRIDIDVYGDPSNKNAIKLATNGLKHFGQGKDLIIIDTAGRHKEEKALVKEMNQLSKKINPDEIILVIDGTLGQSAYRQADEFAKNTEIGSIIVTKLDGTAKGGGAISAAAATNAPIKFIGVGEDLSALEKFNPKGFAGRILGMGDLESIIEDVKRAEFLPDEDRAMAMMKGHITYSDMLELFESMNKMGGIKNLMTKLPGIGNQLDDTMINTSKESMKTFKSIIFSMTKDERNARVKLGKSRVERIAKGAGVSQEKVKELVKQKKMSEGMIKQMTKGRRRGKGQQSPFPFDMMNMGV